MKVRVYGAQPDELRLYEEAEKQGDLSFVFAKAPLNEETVQEVQDCEALILLTNCQVNEKVAEELSKRGVKYLACRRHRPRGLYRREKAGHALLQCALLRP